LLTDTKSSRANSRLFPSLFWLGLGLYPLLFSIMDNRSLYVGAQWGGPATPAATSSNPIASYGTVFVVAFGGLCVGYFAKRNFGHTENSRWFRGRQLVLIAYFLTLLLAFMAKGEFTKLFPVGVAAIVCVVAVSEARTLTNSVSALIWVLRIQIFGSLVAGVVNPDWALVPTENLGRSLFGIDSRLIGFAPAPNYLAMCAVILLALEVSDLPRLNRKALRVLSTAASLICLLWAQSRTELVIGLAVLVLAAIARTWSIGAATFAGRLVTLVVVPFAVAAPFVVTTLGIATQASLSEISTNRTDIWIRAVDLVATSPLFGVVYDETVTTISTLGYSYYNVHNQFLESWISGGLGAATLLAVLILIVSFRARSSQFPVAASLLTLYVVLELPFGTPFKLESLSWSLIGIAVWLSISSSYSESNRRASALREDQLLED